MSSSEPKYDTPPAPTYKTPPALVAFTLTVLILCFVAFSVVYVCKYCFAGFFHTWALQRTTSGSLVRLSPDRSPSRGLDNTLLEKFPTFLYSSVKDLRKEKSYSLECAICLLEFDDDSMLRLLTICCHVFHQECIDLWLESHKTCPVCRTDLDSPPNQMSKHGEGNHNNNNNNLNVQEGMTSLPCDDIHIDVRGEESDNVGEITRAQVHEGDQHDHHVGMSMQQQEDHRFSRSHSTGHSIVTIRGEEKDHEKYTLRLPEHVIRGGHNYTRSCTNYNEMKLTIPTPCSNCGFVKPVIGSSSLACAQEA
ncbi:putative transcription factor C2H2 family [Medicago truncatula]|uniref:RING-type E3 ubiquitin transferase n=1 Tax=Medicago truncatula TaxID=3880 RepID=G7KFV0_MEDTR|nr:RING-H2 finger protein ATL29 [Medicago truncatula]AES99137.1 anaphase-promoting complex subunit 11 RING-H2 finger protein [Medicago truncatula]RHN56843.1 putative transcription factor C2H2 family [Medicago truncatula]